MHESYTTNVDKGEVVEKFEHFVDIISGGSLSPLPFPVAAASFVILRCCLMDEHDRYDACIDGSSGSARKGHCERLKVEPPAGGGWFFGWFHLFCGQCSSSCQTMLSYFTKPIREFDPRNMWKKVKGEGQIMPQRADEGGKGRMQGQLPLG